MGRYGYGGGHEYDRCLRRNDAHQRHQFLRRPGERLQRVDGGCQGRQDHPHPPDALRLEVQEGGSQPLEVRGAWQHVRAQHEDPDPAVQHRLQEARLLARPHPLPDDARRLRPQRRAQRAEPRREQVQAHLLGRGAGRHHQRDEPHQGEIRPDRPALPVRPARREQGRAGLPRRRPQAAPRVGRLHPADPPARQLGRLVVGQQALLGLRARRPGPAEQPALGHLQELRAAAVLGLRPGDHPVGLAGPAPEPPELLVE